ncbi:MAG TPA: hypothetical protein VKA70_05480 [Blastocatellia bacterium]|nr:hypothetical protein [Blastocatellia bacterium]
MFSKAFIKSGANWLTLIAVMVWATTALAGGFQIAVEAPPQSDPELKNAALIVRTFGCNQPSDANVTATAEGLVAGARQSVKLDLVPTSKGVYAINQQWPAEGHWVVAITGLYAGHTSSALVKLGPGGKLEITNGVKKHKTIQVVGRKLTSEEIDAALQSLAGNTAQADLTQSPAEESTFEPGGWLLATAGALFSVAGFVFIRRQVRG